MSNLTRASGVLRIQVIRLNARGWGRGYDIRLLPSPIFTAHPSTSSSDSRTAVAGLEMGPAKLVSGNVNAVSDWSQV